MSKIMIVDDSKFIRNRLDKLLSERGYETVLAEDGTQAIDAYPMAQPDVVLMDITMPNMNGLDALAKIRLLDPQAKVVMLTALDQKLIATQAVHMGAKDFLVKPVKPSKLLSALREALG